MKRQKRETHKKGLAFHENKSEKKSGDRLLKSKVAMQSVNLKMMDVIASGLSFFILTFSVCIFLYRLVLFSACKGHRRRWEP
jgi:hypothetical protein